jgi:dolichyl-phosphate beta-glucosyltransferase
MDEVKPDIRLSLVIPCYNESARLPLLAAGLEDFIRRWPLQPEIILVNDGSTDKTFELLNARFSGLAGAQVRILTQANTGKGGALRTGVLQTTGDWVLTLDADMASPPTEVLNWLRDIGGRLEQNTIYIGSREHPESVIKKEGDRKVAGNIFNGIVRLLTPLRLRDTQCGFKLYPGPAARLLVDPLQTMGWAHDVEILYRAQRHGLVLRAMPLTWTAVDGSKISLLRDAVRMLAEVLRIAGLVRREPINPQLLSAIQ